MIRLHCVWMLLACPVIAFGQEPSDADPPEETEAAAEELLAGHSYHGESFNEGPRQAAYLFPGNGEVHFPATCADETVQQFVDQGVGQLHGFWYFEAERSFRQAAALDPDCGIAYWGMAMANRNNSEKRARGFIEQAVQRKEAVSERERRYIEALAAYLDEEAKKGKDAEKTRRQKLVKAYEEILHQYPDDVEAKALLELALWENRTKGIPISSYFAVDALLQQVLAENPLHPCHHFVIHLWDYEKPERALASAALCGESAPAVAHMWHMPGHIYSRLKRYHEAVWQQEASARVDHAHMMRDRVLPDQIHNFAHNNEWLIRNLIHIGRAEAALDLAKNMIELPRHPRFNTLPKRGSARYGRMRLFDVLSQFEMWKEVLKLAETPYLEPTEIPSEQLKRSRYLAVARFRTGDFSGGCEILDKLKEDLANEEDARDAAGTKAEEKARKEDKSDEETEKAVKRARGKHDSRIRELEDAVRELEGHVHLEHAAYEDAATSFEAVTKLLNPGWLAETQLLAGQAEAAVKTARKRVSSNQNETVPLAQLVTLLWQAGEREQAAEAFEQLRAISATMDLDAPVFASLHPIAEELGHAGDWRVPLEYGEDFGTRPELATLGPFRWSPSPAAEWSLPDHQEKEHALQDHAGRPVIVIFYLGYACLHCAEQLQAFAPRVEEFEQAGISLVAISTDDVEGLKQSHENYDEGEFPFPLVADEALEVFRQYRCYDDFEGQPLHGTFLIDAQGLVRWQDISYEPFMDVDFVLNEAERLLSQPATPPPTADQREAKTPGGP
jgi:peroxiredoxin